MLLVVHVLVVQRAAGAAATTTTATAAADDDAAVAAGHRGGRTGGSCRCCGCGCRCGSGDRRAAGGQEIVQREGHVMRTKEWMVRRGGGCGGSAGGLEEMGALEEVVVFEGTWGGRCGDSGSRMRVALVGDR